MLGQIKKKSQKKKKNNKRKNYFKIREKCFWAADSNDLCQINHVDYYKFA